GDLKFETGRIETGITKNANQVLDHAWMLEHPRREVDANRERGQVWDGYLPIPQLPACFLKRPPADGHDESCFFSQRDDVPGIDETTSWMLPAEQGLDFNDPPSR